MKLNELVGQIFQENQIYEILHFDIEQNFENYLSQFIHIYFESLELGQIRINEIAYLPDEDALYAINRKIVGKKGWIEIYNHLRHVDLMICRMDRSGKFSVIGPDINHVQTFRRRSYDIPEQAAPMTPEEERQAFAELAGILDEYSKISKSKKAV